MKAENFSDEFMRGQQDCIDGKPHKSGQSEAYDRGYTTEERDQQIIEWFEERRDAGYESGCTFNI